MVENGLYVIKREFLEIINYLGGDCDMNCGDKRPVFCCLKDSIANKVHVVMQKQNDISEIRRKFKRILSMEFKKPNYFPQHISDIREYLIKELNCEESKQGNTK